MTRPLCVLCALCVEISASFSQVGSSHISFCESPSTHWMLTANFDTVSGYWSPISPLSKPLYGVTSYYWSDSGKVFVCGGADTLDVSQTSCYFFDPVANTYSPKDSLPVGRSNGNLVRVRDSLYLVGSVGPLWHYPDGMIYKYDPRQNLWTAKDTMPHPFLHESAACVWRDSLIFFIGGSSDGWFGPTNIVRIYNPWTDTWKVVSPGSFPVNVTSAHAECLGDSMFVVGGYGNGLLNSVYRGLITVTGGDTISVAWTLYDVSPFGTGVYRVGGGRIGNILLYGPAMASPPNVANQIFGYMFTRGVLQDTVRLLGFLPNPLDSAGNRPTIAIKTSTKSPFEACPRSPDHSGLAGRDKGDDVLTDSVHFFLFGGYTSTRVIAASEQYTYFPSPIGITSTQNNIPTEIFLDQNYPNPFNPVTKIEFGISPLSFGEGLGVRLIIYDLLGREVAVLVDGLLKPGTYEILWNAGSAASGVYFYTLWTGSKKSLTRKLVLLK